MTYYYTDPARENEETALPDVEVFHSKYWRFYDHENGGEILVLEASDAGDFEDRGYDLEDEGEGWFYAFGFIGCLWDSEPVGPFDLEEHALREARRDAGFE